MKSINVTPSAARLTESLRDVGYDFNAAVADIVDNSITAKATQIDIIIEFDGPSSRVFIADNGSGMSANSLQEALRFGSRRAYENGDLGRYGLGLKTASLSQGRSLTVVTRKRKGLPVLTRQLDLDLVIEFDEWLIVEPEQSSATEKARRLLEDDNGTVVIWQKLDRVVPAKNAAGGWARRRFENLTQKLIQHLGMVFHKFLAGDADCYPLCITVNGSKLTPWDPFARGERGTKELQPEEFEVEHGDTVGTVTFHRFVLPGRDKFSSGTEFDRMSGPMKWNRQQGIYTYRANRLVQWGGWSGIRAIDEHTKLARASLEFNTDLDAAFNINVAKMRVAIPSQLRQMLERPINEMCIIADAAYRNSSKRPTADPNGRSADAPFQAAEIGLALKSAAVQIGEYAALKRIASELRNISPDAASTLGI